jgi:dihydroxyacetone kinase-like protein
MPETIGPREFAGMVCGAALAIRTASARLAELDSKTGDGDHGTTMVRALDRMQRAVEDCKSGVLRDLLENCGWALLGIDGGAAGPLLGSFFLGLADATNADWDVRACAAAFESGLAALRKQTNAQVGDKTVMDALIPAVEALVEASHEGSSLSNALARAAGRARAGAISTTEMVARCGRARYLGEQTRGHPDPGATSFAILLQGFHDGFVQTVAAATDAN